jgi:hypothetical protein
MSYIYNTDQSSAVTAVFCRRVYVRSKRKVTYQAASVIKDESELKVQYVMFRV